KTLEGTGFPQTRGPDFPAPSVDVEAVHKERGDSLVPAATTASLDAQQDSSNITKIQSKETLNEPTPQGEGLGSFPRRQETMRGAMDQIRPEGALIQSSDPPLSTGHTVGSREDRMEYELELMDPVQQPPYDLPLSGGHIPGSDEVQDCLRLGDPKAVHKERGNSLVPAATTASLDAQQDSSNITKIQSKATLNEPTPQGEGSGSFPRRQETMRGAMAQIRPEGALIQSSDPPLSTGHTVGSREDRMEYELELMDHVQQPPYNSPVTPLFVKKTLCHNLGVISKHS
nr:hypothetical protein [Tanacetum cinerariifolium]